MLTGGSTGIGREIVKVISSNTEYNIIVIGRNNPGVHRNTSFYQVDLTNYDLLNSTIVSILRQVGPIDVLINNAGLGVFNNIEDIKISDWQKLQAVNLTAPFCLMSNVIPDMKRRNLGKIINITSDADSVGFAGAGPYCASKYGLLGLSEAVRKEVVGFKISVTTIAPARVDTNFNGKRPGDRPNSLKPIDVAKQVLHVISSPFECHIESIRLKSFRE